MNDELPKNPGVTMITVQRFQSMSFGRTRLYPKIAQWNGSKPDAPTKNRERSDTAHHERPPVGQRSPAR
jgi:hypothetical protein